MTGYKVVYMTAAQGESANMATSATITYAEFKDKLPFAVDLNINYYIPYTGSDQVRMLLSHNFVFDPPLKSFHLLSAIWCLHFPTRT